MFLSYFESMINITAGELNIVFFTHASIVRTWSAQQTSPKQVLDFWLGLKFNGNIKKCPGERRVWVFRYFANRNFCWKKGTFTILGLVYFPYHFDLTSIVTSQNEYVKMWLASTLYSIFGTKQVTFWTLQTHRKIQQRGVGRGRGYTQVHKFSSKGGWQRGANLGWSALDDWVSKYVGFDGSFEALWGLMSIF